MYIQGNTTQQRKEWNPTICDNMDGPWGHYAKWSESWPHGLYSPWNSPGQDTGVGSFSLP